jgi:hypothetical protein
MNTSGDKHNKGFMIKIPPNTHVRVVDEHGKEIIEEW